MLRVRGWVLGGVAAKGASLSGREGEGGMRTLPISAELGSPLALAQRTKLIRESVQFVSVGPLRRSSVVSSTSLLVASYSTNDLPLAHS